MKRTLISLTLVLLTTFGAVKLFKFTQRDQYVIEVVNKSNEPIGAVQLMELGDCGNLGPLSVGESKRVTLDEAQVKKPVYLAFGASDKIERNSGWHITDKSNDGKTFFRLEINSDNSVTVHHEGG
jgi:hypothetical protein